jgi:N-acetylmuramoyl-L-alanine amidase
VGIIYRCHSLTEIKRNRLKNISLLIALFSICNINIYAIDDNIKLKTVVIDPGHGGEDPGASGIKTKEKDVVLAVGLKLGKLINENLKDVKVIFTRDEDKFIPLHERAELANKNNADLFISIHANANTNHAVFGSETYAMGLHTNEKNMEVAKKENAVITYEKDYSVHYEGYDPNSAESFIIFTLMQNTHLGQSLEFAGYIQNKLEKSAERTSRGVKQAGFLVLWKTTMPSVLVETGYISNPEEEKFLNSDAGQSKLAMSIFKAFADYKNQIESKSASAKQGLVADKEKQDIKPVNNTIQKNLNDTVIFKVQIISSSKKISLGSKQFKKCKEIEGFKKIEELHSTDNYKYFVNSDSNYSDMLAFNKKVKKYYPKAFIVAFKNGKMTPLNEVIKKGKL